MQNAGQGKDPQFWTVQHARKKRREFTENFKRFFVGQLVNFSLYTFLFPNGNNKTFFSLCLLTSLLLGIIYVHTHMLGMGGNCGKRNHMHILHFLWELFYIFLCKIRLVDENSTRVHYLWSEISSNYDGWAFSLQPWYLLSLSHAWTAHCVPGLFFSLSFIIEHMRHILTHTLSPHLVWFV